jgi:Ran GTPase-activating protein (RanGAP) involved in mRNA processing and transport
MWTSLSVSQSCALPEQAELSCAQIAKALEGDSSMVSLDVGGNNIGPDGIAVLAEALRGNETLRTLELGYNPIREKGAQALSDVVKYDLKVRRSCREAS